MDITHRKNSSYFFMIALAVAIVVLPLLFMPEPQKIRKPGLVLRTEAEIASMSQDRNRNSTPDWQDTILASISSTTQSTLQKEQVSEEVKNRLDDPNNITSSFTKNLIISSAYNKQKGEISEDDQVAMVAGLLRGESDKLAPKLYTTNDITLYGTDSLSNKKEYGNNLATIFITSLRSGALGDDFEVFMNYSESKNKKELTSLVARRDVLSTALEQLITMNVPPSATVFHVSLINALSSFVTVIEGMSNADEDPIKAFVLFGTYNNKAKALWDSMAVLQNYFIQENVTFAPQEKGYVLMKK